MTRATSSRRTSTRRFQGVGEPINDAAEEPLVPLVAISAVILSTIRAIVAIAGSNRVAKPTLVFPRGENDDLTAARTPIFERFSFAPPSFLFINLLLSLARLSGLLDPHFQIFGVFQFVQYRGSRRRREAAARTWPRQRPIRIVKVTFGKKHSTTRTFHEFTRSNSRRTREPFSPVQQKQSTFHPRARRNAFRCRDVRLQSLAALPVARMEFLHRSALTFMDRNGLFENHQGGKTGGVTVRMKFWFYVLIFAAEKFRGYSSAGRASRSQ